MKLSELTAGLEKVFTSQHMAKRTLAEYRRRWKRLGEFLTSTYGDDEFDYERGMAYFQNQFGIRPEEQPGRLTYKQKHVFRIINTLQEYRLTGGISYKHFLHNRPPEFTEKFASFISECEAALSSEGLSEYTVRLLRQKCQYFLLFPQQVGVDDLSKIDMTVLDSYMKTWAPYSLRTVQNNLVALRNLLRYLLTRKIIDVDLAKNLHAKEIPTDSLIPSGWSNEEIRKLLDSIDRNNPQGKRDFAIILLGCVMGIRAGDIVALKFSNLKLRAKRIVFVQHKTKKPLDLPIPKEVGWPLIDHIQNGRPKVSESDLVFIKHSVPFDGFSSGAVLSGMLERRREKAGIAEGGMHRGFHSLRHAAATGYLEMGTPLPVITEILGHADMNTTSIYLKRDLKKLMECVLDPEELKDDKGDKDGEA